MKKATYRDREKVTDILCQAFIDVLIPNSINFVVKSSGNRYKRLKLLMEFQFDMAVRYGSVFLTDDDKGCILYFEKQGFGIKKLLLELKLLLFCIGIENILKILRRERLLKSFHPEEKFVHLWLMAVLPNEQGRGIGTKLLKESFKRYHGTCIYVETTTPENRTFYTQNGFEIFHETFELDYPLYFLKKINADQPI
ncbi:Acetyltransferase (GNAT) domain-containing protein [Chryseobacterium soldanellicola]|uniref:Acetyltransferase (GNAT) domain-containing protein n=1 Tax=Chryseobacterium soldanellicola TaxID=311333 RepID=A0A1H0YHT5_9FLAO|nr:GNAT family N-acetyltransferase [Chryseobacterium soldanellicola]SDQ14613.1 Acetyltransferase (GNAT) domain-containing protein [Chryseobacterium soldanellicola]